MRESLEVGDIVEVVRAGCCYTNNNRMAEQLKLMNYARDRGSMTGHLKNGSLATVIREPVRQNGGDTIMTAIVLERETQQYEYLIGVDGLQFKEKGVAPFRNNQKFFKPIALMMDGIVTFIGGKYIKIYYTTGWKVPLTDEEVVELKQWQKSQKPFDDNLFTL